MNIAERGEYWERWRPSSPALQVDGAATSYGALAARVRRIAAGLAANGVAPGARVGILGANSAAWCEVALGTLHAGAAIVPLNIRMAPPEVAHALDLTGCACIAYDAQFAPLYAQADDAGRATVALDADAPAQLTLDDLLAHAPMACAPRDGGDPALLAFTSGTTGFPKAATLTHANIAAHASQWGLAEDALTTRRALLPVPLAFTGGVLSNFLGTYARGGSVVLETDFVPARILRLLVEERITAFVGVPVMWQAVAEVTGFADADLSALSTAICGGAPVPQPLVDAYLAKGVAIRQAYALTEAAASATSVPREHATTKGAAAGYAHADTFIRLTRDDGSVIDEPGEVGEICVKGPQVMAGYWEDPEATAAALRDGWLFTGDAARYDEDGMLVVVDRLKSMFVSGGLNVYPAEVERVVAAFPGVLECAAFGIEHPRWGKQCAVVVRSADVVDEDALEAHCRANLSDYKVPRTVIHTDGPLPRGMSGKVLRSEVEERYVEAASPTRLP
jgi:fatty-acyl-CoA synthase